MKKMFLYIVVFWLLLWGNAQGSVVAYRDNYLENSALSGRGLAMGGAVSALANNGDGLLYNPAGLAGAKNYSFFLKNDSSLVDVSRTTLITVMPLDEKQTFSLGYTRIGVNNIKIAADTGSSIQIIDSAGYTETGFFAGYANRISSELALGATLKYYQNNLTVQQSVYDAGSAVGTDLDVGLLYSYSDEVDVSLGFKNVLSATNKSGTLRWANNYEESFDFGAYVGLGWRFPEQKILYTADLRASKIYNKIINIGMEYQASDYMSFRMGYNSLNNLSGGLGLKMGEISIDYAYIPDFGTSADNKHYISLSYGFDTFSTARGEELAEPETQTDELRKKREKRAVGQTILDIFNSAEEEDLELPEGSKTKQKGRVKTTKSGSQTDEFEDIFGEPGTGKAQQLKVKKTKASQAKGAVSTDDFSDVFGEIDQENAKAAQAEKLIKQKLKGQSQTASPEDFNDVFQDVQQKPNEIEKITKQVKPKTEITNSDDFNSVFQEAEKAKIEAEKVDKVKEIKKDKSKPNTANVQSAVDNIFQEAEKQAK